MLGVLKLYMMFKLLFGMVSIVVCTCCNTHGLCFRTDGSENHYGKSDPLAPTPYDAIAARRDLDPTSPRLDGAIDAKIVSRSLLFAILSPIIPYGVISDFSLHGYEFECCGDLWTHA